ncbi:hypothetical protein [Virgibacillus sp. Bac332]|uniref:hypothetical protein n=1 Tax=Virgibacillus sp. Bac332 TaxID=2419842 RepID=UPI000EF53EBB|nr:hypothetical protein [Virgibacillus sp. Bac332]
MKYRKKPVVIEAIKFDDKTETLVALTEFMNDQPEIVIGYETKKPILKIETLEGTMTANEGDYIIKGVNGEFYPCKPDIFHQTYEKVV